MRILGLIFSSLVTVSLATLILIYLEQRIGEQRIAVRQEWLSADVATTSPLVATASAER
jgi:hypothetical protein